MLQGLWQYAFIISPVIVGMNERALADAIRDKVSKVGIADQPNLPLSEKYSHWTIGVTNSLNRRKGEHADGGKNVDYWRGWASRHGEDRPPP